MGKNEIRPAYPM